MAHPLQNVETIRLERRITMTKFGFTAMIAGGLATAVLGLASPAHADYGHNQWVNEMGGASTSAPHVNTSAHR